MKEYIKILIKEIGFRTVANRQKGLLIIRAIVLSTQYFDSCERLADIIRGKLRDCYEIELGESREIVVVDSGSRGSGFIYRVDVKYAAL